MNDSLSDFETHYAQLPEAERAEIDREAAEGKATVDRQVATMDEILMLDSAEILGDAQICSEWLAYLVWEAVQRRVATGRVRLAVLGGRQYLVASARELDKSPARKALSDEEFARILVDADGMPRGIKYGRG